jgi:NitT/TauT family transport system substrate-binding protein
MKMNIRFNLAILILLVVIVFMPSCKQKPTPPSKNGKNTKLDIGYSRLRISLPVFVAKEKGFFEANGIDANLIMFETAQPLMQAIVAGQIDIGGYTALPITYNGMIRSKKDLLFLTTMIEDEKHRISYLLRKTPKTGETSRINSIADLKGKKIGILPTIAYKAWLEDLLKDNNIDPELDVVIQQISPVQQGLALKNGGVDALFTNDPVATSLIQKGIGELFSDFVEVPKYVMDPFPFGSFNVSKKWADKNPELLFAIEKSLNQAIDWAEKNQSDAKLSMVNYLPEQFKNDVSKYPDVEYLRTDESDDEVFNKIADEYLKMGIISEDIDLTNLVIEK